MLVVGASDVAAGTVGMNPRAAETQRDVPLADLKARMLAEAAPR